MDIFKCKYLKHENEEIIGFCLNQNCQNTTLYCYKCLNTTHSEHINDCIRFTEIIQIANESKQVYNQLRKQFKDISKRIENLFEQFQKKLDQEITTLENMTQQIKNQDYLTFKSQLHILKQFYSGEKKSYRQIQIKQFIQKTQNNIIEQHQQYNKEHVIWRNQVGGEFDSPLNLQEAEKLLNEGLIINLSQERRYIFIQVSLGKAIECYDQVISINPKYYVAWNNKGTSLSIYLDSFRAVQNQKKYQDAIECFDKAITINPNYDVAWNNKGNQILDIIIQVMHYQKVYLVQVVQNLNKYQQAIECYDKAISINKNYDVAWNNKGNLLSTHFQSLRLVSNLNKYQASIECFDKAIFINPKNDLAWNNKGNALEQHLQSLEAIQNLNIFQEAIECYDKAIFINPNNDLVWNNKGTSLSSHLFSFGVIINLNNYQEAIVCFDKAFSINPKNDNVWSNKGFALTLKDNNLLLHNLKKYEDAIICYDKALSISITALRLQRKADSLKVAKINLKIFELDNKQEAKKTYQDALEKGSNHKNYIEKQLQKL